MAKQKPEQKTETTEPKFAVKALRPHAKQLFGVPVEVFDGAFHGEEGEFTKDEAKSKIEAFLKKEVK